MTAKPEMPDDLERLLCNYTRNDRNSINRFLGAAEACGYQLTRADSPSPATVEKIRKVRKHAVELWHKCVNDVEPNRLSNEMDTICDRLIDKIDEALAQHEAVGEK